MSDRKAAARHTQDRQRKERVSTNVDISALVVVQVVAEARGIKPGTLLAEIIEEWAAKQPREQA